MRATRLLFATTLIAGALLGGCASTATSITPTSAPSATFAPTATASFSATPVPTALPTDTPVPTETSKPTAAPSATVRPTAVPTATRPTATPVPTKAAQPKAAPAVATQPPAATPEPPAATPEPPTPTQVPINLNTTPGNGEYNDELPFATSANDPSVGPNDGDGIVSVSFQFFDQNGNEVYGRTEQNPHYCAFGGGDNGSDCQHWKFSEHDNEWPNGKPAQAGQYKLIVTVNDARGGVSLDQRDVTLILNEPPTITPTPEPTPKPTATLVPLNPHTLPTSPPRR